MWDGRVAGQQFWSGNDLRRGADARAAADDRLNHHRVRTVLYGLSLMTRIMSGSVSALSRSVGPCEVQLEPLGEVLNLAVDVVGDGGDELDVLVHGVDS